MMRLALSSNFPMHTQKTKNGEYTPVPWEGAVCAMCTSELDCRNKDEFCNIKGCCEKGECATDADCLTIASTNPYYRVPGVDSYGYDLNPMHPQDNETVLRAACDTNKDCVAYNSYGMIKYGLQPTPLWISQPPLPGLSPWALYVKKNALLEKNPHVLMTNTIKTYCSKDANKINQRSGDATNRLSDRDITGVCRQCLVCDADTDCPEATMCDLEAKCCVNNPCYTATPEKGAWVDGHYSRDPQCDCPAEKPYCCLFNSSDIYSAYCSATSCASMDKLKACAYICEDPHQLFDAVICKANQRCCNQSEGTPACCSPGSDCGAQSNACMANQPMVKCAATAPFADVDCFASQTCCNADTSAPPVCCSNVLQTCSPRGNACSAKTKQQ